MQEWKNTKDVDKLEKVQRKAACFIKGDYHSREPGSMSRMMNELDLPTLESRRKDNHLCFMFKISRGLVPAIPPTEYLTPVRQKRKIKAKTFENSETKNFVEKHQQLNDNCFTTINSKLSVYANYFFPRTISEWNQLDDTSHPTFDSFKKSVHTKP